MLSEMNVSAQKLSDLIVAAIGSWDGRSRYWCYEAKLVRSEVEPTKRHWFADARVCGEWSIF